MISGNRRFGVMLASTFSDPAEVNVVQGNYIGTDETGMAAVGNGIAGIGMVSDHHSVIGGTEPGAGNVISGNGLYGIEMYAGNGTVDVRVQGNLIGTNALGTGALPNQHGITLAGFTCHHITHDVLDWRNGSIRPQRDFGKQRLTGIEVLGRNATNVVIQGNYIGTDITGTYAVPNAQEGILLAEGFAGEGAPGGVVIGGTELGAGNLISGNRWQRHPHQRADAGNKERRRLT